MVEWRVVFLSVGLVGCAPGGTLEPAVSPPTEPTPPASGAETLLPELSPAPPEPLAPSPPPPPVAFPDRETVTVGELTEALGDAADSIRESPVVRQEYEALLTDHGLDEHAAPYDDYLRVRVVFEATRDGGLWGIVWDITNRIGHSDDIWRQWQTAPVPEPGDWQPTAVAECDELSALFAFLVRRLGVERAGFLGGGPMHIVAHWTIRRETPTGGRREVRIVVPTSQIFLTPTATLGTREINAYSAKTVWNYIRQDVHPDFTIPAPLARYFVGQLPLAALPSAELQARRNQRGGS